MLSKKHQFVISLSLCVLPLAAQLASRPGKLDVYADRAEVVIERGKPDPRVCFNVTGLSKKGPTRVTLYSRDARNANPTAVQATIEGNQLCTTISWGGMQAYQVIETDNANNAIAQSDEIRVEAIARLLVRPVKRELLVEDGQAQVNACFDLLGQRAGVARTTIIRSSGGPPTQPRAVASPRATRQCEGVIPGWHLVRFTDYDDTGQRVAESDWINVIALPELVVTYPTTVEVKYDQPTPRLCFDVRRNGSGAAHTILYRKDPFDGNPPLNEVTRRPGEDLCIGVAIAGKHKYFVYDYDDYLRPVARSREFEITVTTDLPTGISKNGIAVGRAKLFDDRALRTMQEDVERALAALKVNLTGVTEKVGGLQGGSEDRSFIGIQATTLPIPGLTTNTTATETANAPAHTTTTQTTSSGVTTTESTTAATVNTQRTTTTTMTQTAVSPTTTVTAPTTATTSLTGTAGPFPGPFSQSAQDLLVEHTELVAQATNLRLLLQRALSDRVLLYGDRSKPRLNPVFGFQISVDPLKEYRNAVAEAIVTVSSRWSGQHYKPEIVALLPKEKTYNVGKLMNSTRAFNLGAVTQVLNIGGTFSFTRNRVYLVKDTDTVAFERVPAVDTSEEAFGNVEFGWQFRPVLGEKSVTPGIRHVFAVLALPSNDAEGWGGIVHVRTQWRKYDPKSKTVYGEPMGVTYQEPYFVSVPPVSSQGRAVAARIDDLEWHDNGGGNAVIALDGSFPAETLMTVADQVIRSAADGMLLRTQNRIIFSVPIPRLVLGPPMLVDAFGVATAVRHPKALAKDGLEIVSATAKPNGKTNLDVLVTVRLPPREVTDPSVNPGPRELKQPVVLVGNNIYGTSTGSLTSQFEGNDQYSLRFRTPLADATTARTVRVVDLLYGDGILREKEIDIPEEAKKPTPTELHVLASTPTITTLAIVGKNFATDDTHQIRLRVGNVERSPTTGAPMTTTFRQFEIATDMLRAAQRIIVTFKDGEPVLFPVPSVAIDRPKIIKQETIVEGFAGKVRLDGVGLGFVQKVEYNRTEIKSSTVPDDPSILFLENVALLTATSGEKDIELITIDGSRTPARVFVQAKPAK